MISLLETKKRLLALVLAGIAISAALAFLSPGLTQAAYVPQTRTMTLIVQTVQIEIFPSKTITFWSYNGTVPGPTIRAFVGDTLRITLQNQHTMKHSIHVHGLTFNITSDGSQGDPGKSDLGIIDPGQQYTYSYKLGRAGIFAYHCHSSDRYEPSVHMQQGLYGAIIVEDPTNPLPTPAREQVLFLGEAYGQVSFSMAHGCAYCYGNSKYFTINARSMPYTPTITARPGELVRLYLINIGNDIHSFHLHGHAMYTWEIINGQWASIFVENDNVPFIPLETAIVDVTAGSPGKWLYHCHVEPHGDSGMMGIFEVQSPTMAPLQLYGPANLVSQLDGNLNVVNRPETADCASGDCGTSECADGDCSGNNDCSSGGCGQTGGG